MKLSIVTTLYQSSPHVNEFYQRITAEAQKITKDYEIIFVDDGSSDDSLQKAIALYQQDSKVKVIELSRNFGHHKAIMTGLSHAKGEFVFLIDSDLEEEPELLEKFWTELHNDKETDVVYGVQELRKGGWFERWSGQWFYTIFNFLSYTKIPENMTTIRLMKKKYVLELLRYKEVEFHFGGVMMDCGFRQKPVTIKKHFTSMTTYDFNKKVKLAAASVVSFSNMPLISIFNFGLLVTFFSIIYIGKIIVGKFFFGIAVKGWTSIMVSIWFFGGVTILFMGIIGIYISKIFLEVKNRPYTVVKAVYQHNPDIY